MFRFKFGLNALLAFTVLFASVGIIAPGKAEAAAATYFQELNLKGNSEGWDNNPAEDISFTISNVTERPDTIAHLLIYAYDIREENGETARVYWGGDESTGLYLGNLTGMNHKWVTSVFEVPLDAIQNTNQVYITVSDTSGSSNWEVEVKWAQLLFDGGPGEDARVDSPTASYYSETAMSVSWKMHAVKAGPYNSELVIVENGNTVYDASGTGNMSAGMKFNNALTYTYTPGTVHTTYFMISDYYNGDSQQVGLVHQIVTIKQSTVPALEKLEFADGTQKATLSPSFTTLTRAYSTTVPYSTAAVTPEVKALAGYSNTEVTARINGDADDPFGPAPSQIPLQVGRNVIEYLVTTSKYPLGEIYTVTIDRLPKLDGLLSSPEVQLSPLFDGNSPNPTPKYHASVANVVDKLVLTPVPPASGTLNPEDVTVRINGQPFEDLVTGTWNTNDLPLEVGRNEMTVRVTSPDNQVYTDYSIVVDRAPALTGLGYSSSATLTPEFRSDVYAYTTVVGHTETSIKLTPNVNDGEAVELRVNSDIEADFAPVVPGVQTGELALNAGTNKIELRVKSPDYDAALSSVPAAEKESLVKIYTLSAVLDVTAPIVQFSTNGRAVAGTSAASVVTVSDAQSGVDEGTLTYAWSQSTTLPTNGWESFANGDSISRASGDGNWYLHIQAEDKVGNAEHAVSNAFLLDNISPSVTVSSSVGSGVNVAFPVTFTFSEGVSGFSLGDVEMDNATISNLTSENASTYTATVTPTTSGENVTVTVAAAAAEDAAGNENTVSNTLSVLYDTTKPAVTFVGFNDGQLFIAPPAEMKVMISEALYLISDGTELDSSNALSLFSMKKDDVDFSSYTASYDAQTRIFTISFDTTLEDGEYEVLIAGNTARNVTKNILDASSASFTVAIPVITSISTNPTSLISGGGSTVVSITGMNLNNQHVSVYVDGVEAAAANILTNTSAEATVLLPRNHAYMAKEHIFTVYLNGVEVPDRSVIVRVDAAPLPVAILSNNAELAELHVIAADKQLLLSPAFTSRIFHYVVQTDEDKIELQAVAADPRAVVRLQNEPVRNTISIPLELGTQEIELTVQAEDGTVKVYTILMTRNNEIKETGCPFMDIQKHWAEADICEAASLGIVEGVGENRYAPNLALTRSEFAVMLARTLQLSDLGVETSNPISFSDQESIPVWARPMVKAAVAKGIITGYPDGTFSPQQTITRKEMAVMLSKAIKWDTSGKSEVPFTDYASIPMWALPHVATVYEQKLLQGRGGNLFVPNGITTRAEAAVTLLRLWRTLQ